MVKVTVDQEKCIGCRACLSVCDNFGFDDGSGKAFAKNGSPAEAGCNRDAAEVCPVEAIAVSG